MVPGKGLEPSQRMLADFKSAVSAIPPSGHKYHLMLSPFQNCFEQLYATVVLEDADAEEMDEEFVKEFIRVAESQKQHFGKGEAVSNFSLSLLI